MPGIDLDWNVVTEILIGVILYKIVDLLVSWVSKLISREFRKIIIIFRLKK